MAEKRHLSQERIATFSGNVLPLQLLGVQEYGSEKIIWQTDNKKVVQICGFSQKYPTGGEFTDGVLLSFLSQGEATVTAKHENITYCCKVTVRPRLQAGSSDELQYFVGDMHDHTGSSHKPDVFCAREPEMYPINHYMKQMDDGRMDFAVVSDHTDVVNAREFFRGYVDARQAGERVVWFPGAEGQVTQKETDRYGITHMHGGEILMFHSGVVYEQPSWKALFAELKNSPNAFCGYPHPQIIGHSVKGVWNFRFAQNNDARFQKRFRFLEMGDGTDRSSNVINEYAYSLALDAGLRVSPTCSSDAHGRWGYDRFPGKTVIMAPHKSKEAFLDAIFHNRMYATSTGNVKLRYSVNGQVAPVTLREEGTYRFRVELDYFRPDEPDTHIKTCQLITDGGIPLVQLENVENCFDFTVYSRESHYFYLCLSDALGRKTWSCPVWTGKPFQKKREKKRIPIPKAGLRAYDYVSQTHALELINDDPLTPWHSDHTTADLLLELEKEQSICALSHYPIVIDRKALPEKNMECQVLSQLPSAYRISLSRDGNAFTPVAQGLFRMFGEEETICFPRQKAKYIRLEILRTVGKNWGREETAQAPLTIGEITLWN